MGMWNNFVNKLPWNAYAQQQRELNELAREFFGEKGIYKDDTGELPDQTDFNPSDFDLDVYDKMMKDGQVNAGLMMIKLATTAKGFTVIGDDEETREYADFINENFELLRGNMEDVISEMLSALEYGYSCTEKVFDWNDKKDKIILKKMKVLDPHTISVKTNRFGDIEFVKQTIGGKEIKIPPEKIMWLANQKRFGNLYGESVLRQAYKHWYIKDKMYRFANIAYERYGTPLLVGKVEDAKDIGKMESILKRINGMTGLAISGESNVTAIQGSNADFVGYIEHHDKKIMESMLVPPMMLSLARGQSGSYALSDNMFDIFVMRLESLQRDIKSLIEEEVIRPLVDLNFPNVKKYPAFSFKPLAEKDMEKLANVFTQMISAQVISPSEDWLREELGFPAMTEETRKELEEARSASKAQSNTNTPDEDSEGSETPPNDSEKGSDEEGK
ncbi:portal protein [Bacillus phage 056SW001B]|uniref:Portal protein n=2 Tax=Gettysburgvirus TaxID=3425034 RepID=A0A5J6T3Z4_9CAUD|nr:portal protein [Bacillus phage 019DV002]QFG05238.1 portal protein [Bacillus phage 019DV004]QFR56475.1 portal protein [Bacillus phage 056SW001B]